MSNLISHPAASGGVNLISSGTSSPTLSPSVIDGSSGKRGAESSVASPGRRERTIGHRQ